MNGKNLLSLMPGVDTKNHMQTVSENSPSITTTPVLQDLYNGCSLIVKFFN